jgi:hypothetical protein
MILINQNKLGSSASQPKEQLPYRVEFISGRLALPIYEAHVVFQKRGDGLRLGYLLKHTRDRERRLNGPLGLDSGSLAPGHGADTKLLGVFLGGAGEGLGSCFILRRTHRLVGGAGVFSGRLLNVGAFFSGLEVAVFAYHARFIFTLERVFKIEVAADDRCAYSCENLVRAKDKN